MAFLTNESQDKADQAISMAIPVRPSINSRIWGNIWIWAKIRIMLVLFILAILALTLIYMTPPITIHPQNLLHVPSKHSVSPNRKSKARSTNSSAR
jgi:hypothetical protein